MYHLVAQLDMSGSNTVHHGGTEDTEEYMGRAAYWFHPFPFSVPSVPLW